MTLFEDFATWAALIGVLVTALAGYVGVRYTARSARAAQEEAERRANDLEKNKVDALAYERARDNYDAAIATMQREIDQLKAGREYDRQEHKRQIESLQNRVQELETARASDRATISSLVAYVKVLLDLLRDNRIAYPPPPTHLSDH